MTRSRSRSPSPPPRRRRKSSRSRSRSPARRYSRSRSHSNSRDNSRDHPQPSKILGVFGLNYSTTRRDLERHFSKYGEIDKVDLITDNQGRSRGFGFISFINVDDAKRARSAMTDKEFHGRRIRVDFSISKGPHQRTPGQYMGRSRGGSSRERRFSRSPSPRRRRSPSPSVRRRSRSPSPSRNRRYSRSASPPARRRD